MKKNCLSIFVSTDQESYIFLYKDGKLKIRDTEEKLTSKISQSVASNQHLYILSEDEKPKNGDWFLYTDGSKIFPKQYIYDGLTKSTKIIATTNSELHYQFNCNCKKQNKDFAYEWTNLKGEKICRRCESLMGIFIPKISISDIQDIISVYNKDDKMANIADFVEKKYPFEFDPDGMRNQQIRHIRKGYIECLLDNEENKFTLEDVRKVAVGLADWALDKSKTGRQGEDSHDIFNNLVQSLDSSKPKLYIVVEYENTNAGWQSIANNGKIGSTFVPDNYNPKLKDGNIIIVK